MLACWGITEFPLPRGPAVQREFILCEDLQPPRCSRVCCGPEGSCLLCLELLKLPCSLEWV